MVMLQLLSQHSYWDLKVQEVLRDLHRALAIGIILSMFTALVISRLLINAFYVLGAKSEKLYGRHRRKKSY